MPGVRDWFIEGIKEEKMPQTLIAAFVMAGFIVAAFLGILFCIHRIVNGRWYG